MPAATPPPAGAPGPVPVCVFAVTVPCRLVVRFTVPGRQTAWPLLVADPCPYPRTDRFGNLFHHAHVHAMCEPGPRWYRLAPCCRRPYVLTLAAA